MALSFPSSPTVGDIYTVGSKSWRWDGGIWSSKLNSESRWLQVLDDPGTSLTNWTSVLGSWAAAGSYLEQTNTDTAYRILQWNGSFTSSTVMLQAEFYIPTSGTASYPGVYLTLADNVQSGYDKIQYRPAIANYNNHASGAGTWHYFLTAASTDSTPGYLDLASGDGAYDSWRTLVLVVDGASYYGWIDGTFVGVVAHGATRQWNTFSLSSYGTASRWRNIKAWQAVNDLPSGGEVLTPDDFYGLAQTVETVAGTTYSAVIGDIGKLKNATNGSAVTITLDTPTSMGVTAGARIDFRQGGAGQVTFVAGSGATVNATPGLKTRDQYSGATAIAMSTTEWWLIGDLAV